MSVRQQATLLLFQSQRCYFFAGTNFCQLCYSISFTLKLSFCKGNGKLKLFLTEQLRPLASESVPTISSKAQHPNLFDLNRSDNQAGSDDKARGSEWQDRQSPTQVFLIEFEKLKFLVGISSGNNLQKIFQMANHQKKQQTLKCAHFIIKTKTPDPT